MHSFISIARRFHVVSFVLAAVCFAAMSLFCQNAVMGQEAGGEETAVAAAADVGENSPGGQEEGTAENPSDQSNSEKDKQADLNSQEDPTKTAAVEESPSKDQNADNGKSSQNKGSFWQKTWDFITRSINNPKQEITNNWKWICLIIAIINLGIVIYRYFYVIPSRRRKYIENNLNTLNDFKKVASECMRLRYSQNETNDSGTIDFIKYDKAKVIIENVFLEHTGEKYKSKDKTVYEHIHDYWWPKYVPISNEDAYLVILLTWDHSQEAEFNNNLLNHRKTICNIYEKRYNAYWWYWFTHISFWSLFIFILPLLTAVYKVWYYFN